MLQQHVRRPHKLRRVARSRANTAAQMKGVEVTDEMMDAVSGMQLVESVTLLPGNKSNGFTCAAGRHFCCSCAHAR